MYLFSFIALALSQLYVAAAASFFVSPAGSDSSSGTSPSAPFASVARAVAAARALPRPLVSDTVISIRAGAYLQATPLTLTPADSGSSADSMVRFVAGFPGDAPDAPPSIIHAGVTVSAWTQMDATNAVWSAPLPRGVSDTRQLWKDGARVPFSTAGGLGAGATETATGYTAAVADVPWLAASAQQSVSDIELLYTGVGSSWTECRLRVASTAPLPGGRVNITMAQPAWSFHSRAYGQGLPRPVSSANLYATLSPGSASVNSLTRTLYYAALAGEDVASASFLVPSLDLLMLLQGDVTTPSVTPVAWVSFEGLTFSYAGWLEPNSGLGYVDMQSGYRIVAPGDPSNDDAWVPVPGNIQLHAVQNVSFVGCAFTGLGASALVVHDSSQSVRVINNTFRDTSCAGVVIGQVSDVNTTDTTRENGHYVVDGNLFENIPVEYHDCPAILGGYVIDANVTHNAIVNASNGGICIGWGWSRDEATNAGWNTIANNLISRSNYLLEDCGSIYVLGPQPESIMKENFCSHQVKLFGALYTDEGSAYWHITRNVVHDVPEWLHIWTASIHDELVDQNWSDQTYQVRCFLTQWCRKPRE